jgi:ubiquinone/menaquinone biosynthesis C-methylase UbiE
MGNLDAETVRSFGDLWVRFTQEQLSDKERQEIFDRYFGIFPWELLPKNGGEGVDVGCGTGRWGKLVAPRVAKLHMVDASAEALGVCRQNLRAFRNVEFHVADVADMPITDGSLDFAYSIGVLHHIPDTAAGIKSVAQKLKAGAPFLVYLYYAFDNRPGWYQALWRMTDPVRRCISRLPLGARAPIAEVIATGVYLPLARTARVLDAIGLLPRNWPLSYYRYRSFYHIRHAARDRFGTPLEQRFTRKQITSMLEAAGFKEVGFAEGPPYWVALAIKD